MNEGDHTRQTRQFFDAVAHGWTTRYAQDAAIGARLARFREAVAARLSPPASLLDFGCGSGNIALHLAGAGYAVTGLDLSAQMIDQARRADVEKRVTWMTQPESGTRLPFENSSFDGIIISSVLEYIPSLNATLGEFARILRPGGYLIATVPDVRHPYRQRERWFRLALTLPGVARLARHSRWREGADYLRISVNRIPAKSWHQRLKVSGLKLEDWPELDGTLLMFVAQRP